MINIKIPIQAEGSLPDTHATAYILETPDCMAIRKRPIVIVCPGGGYEYVSPREGEPIAIAYNNMGYHAIVLNYSVAPATYPTALYELALLVDMVYEKAEEWHVDTDRIFMQGFSAGGHLVASYGTVLKEAVFKKYQNLKEERLKVAGLILAYPVITSGEFAHSRSFENLLGLKEGTLSTGENALDDETSELLYMLSLENQISADMPPVFIWTTFEDASVPAENSIELVRSLRKAGVVTEFHMFPRGGHGLSLASRLTQTSDGRGIAPEAGIWIKLAGAFIEDRYIGSM